MSNADEMRYAALSNVNVGSFVSVRPCLEGDDTCLDGDINGRMNIKIWEEQMLCLLESQDVAGFVDGEIEPPIKEESEQLYKEWRRRDKLVKGWILGSIGKDALYAVWGQPTARSTWLELQRFFDSIWSSGLVWHPEPEDEFELQNENESSAAGDVDYKALYKAAQTGDWDTAENIFKNKPELLKAKITSDSETALHVAVLAGRASSNFVVRLVELMPKEALAYNDYFGRTALHNAAIVGNSRAASLLVNKDPWLLYNPSYDDNRLPVLEAAINCRRDTLDILINFHEKESSNTFFEGMLGIQLLNEIIASQFVDIALYLVQRYPRLTLLTNKDDGKSALSSLIVATYTLFRRTESSLQRFVYHCIPVQRLQSENLSGNCAAPHYACFWDCQMEWNGVWRKLPFTIQNVVAKLVPRVLKELKQKKASHQQALQLAQYLCDRVSQLPEKRALEIFKKSILVAAKYGVREIAEMIIEKQPSVIYHVDPETRMNIFHLAASLRHENFFNLIYSMSDRKYMFFDSVDKYGNNLMHICGKLAPPQSLDLVTGPALQMQREIQWFKEMEKFVNPSRRTRTNMDGLTPQMLFSMEHRELKAEGEAWMKKTSNSCTVIATLIATVMFASAFTVPGGLESTTGVPLFAGQTAFSIFAIADTISLFTSISSVLAFLSIATSRCEEDFLYLAKTLSMGMFTLFISILFMLLAFGVALYLVPYAKVTWFLWVLAAVAVLPVSQFVLVLFPLLMDVVSSTYHGIFGKRSNRVLY